MVLSDRSPFCMAATVEEIAKHGFVLTPERYVGAEEQEEDGEPFAEKYPRLVAELEQHFKEDERLTNRIREPATGSRTWPVTGVKRR